MEKEILISYLFLLCFTFVSAQFEVGFDVNSNIPNVVLEPPALPTFNNATASVNNSWFWQGYIPSTLPHNVLDNLEWSVAGHIMDADLDMNSFDITEVNDITIENDAQINDELTVNGGIFSKNNIELWGNYFVKWLDVTGVTTYAYIMAGASEFKIASVGETDMNFYYGTLGSNLGASMNGTTGNWNFTNHNLTAGTGFFRKLNLSYVASSVTEDAIVYQKFDDNLPATASGSPYKKGSFFDIDVGGTLSGVAPYTRKNVIAYDTDINLSVTTTELSGADAFGFGAKVNASINPTGLWQGFTNVGGAEYIINSTASADWSGGNYNAYGTKTIMTGDMKTNLVVNRYGHYVSINGIAGNQYGYHVSVAGASPNNYGIYGAVSGGTKNWFIYSTGGDWALAQNNMKIRFGVSSIFNISTDGTNAIFQVTNNGTAPTNRLFWFNSNLSATGYITRTSVYDKTKGSALNYVLDADDYKVGVSNTINHSKFYGYVSYDVADTSRPVINKTTGNVEYPFTKIEEGVLIDDELAVLRQAIYEQNQTIKSLQLELCKLNPLSVICR